MTTLAALTQDAAQLHQRIQALASDITRHTGPLTADQTTDLSKELRNIQTQAWELSWKLAQRAAIIWRTNPRLPQAKTQEDKL